MGPSPAGEETSPESSVRNGMWPLSWAPLVDACADCGVVAELAELVGLMRVEKRFLLMAVVKDVGGDLRAAETVGDCAGSVRIEGGGLSREYRLFRNRDLSSRGLAASSCEVLMEKLAPVGGAVCGDRLSKNGTSTESSMSSYTFSTARSSVSGTGGSLE